MKTLHYDIRISDDIWNKVLNKDPEAIKIVVNKIVDNVVSDAIVELKYMEEV